MEKLKPLADVLEPDGRNLAFVRMDTGKPQTLEEHYGTIADITLAATVPDEVRSYFATVQNVCIYAWYSYDLYPVVNFLSFTAVELALKQRFPSTGNKRQMLGRLMREAVSANLIKEKGFSHVRIIRKNQADWLRWERQILKLRRRQPPKGSYGEVLAETIPYLRNSFAHPHMHTIITPGQAFAQLRILAELINQLFAKASTAVP
jgi:hypothetical protein